LGGIGELIRSGNATQDYQDPISEGGLSAKDYELITIKKKKGAVIVIVGATGTGKTELAYRLAQFIDKPTFAIAPDPKHPHPDFIKPIGLEDVNDIVPTMSTVIYDDIPVYAGNRSYSDALVQQLDKDIPMVEHPALFRHIIFITQSMSIADRHIMQCHLAFFKPGALLADDLERPGIRLIYKRYVDPFFDNKSDEFIKKHAAMYSRSYKGLIYVKMVK